MKLEKLLFIGFAVFQLFIFVESKFQCLHSSFENVFTIFFWSLSGFQISNKINLILDWLEVLFLILLLTLKEFLVDEGCNQFESDVIELIVLQVHWLIWKYLFHHFLEWLDFLLENFIFFRLRYFFGRRKSKNFFELSLS